MPVCMLLTMSEFMLLNLSLCVAFYLGVATPYLRLSCKYFDQHFLCFITLQAQLQLVKFSKSPAEYSETLGLGLDQFYDLGLGLEAETQIISVSDSVSILRL